MRVPNLPAALLALLTSLSCCVTAAETFDTGKTLQSQNVIRGSTFLTLDEAVGRTLKSNPQLYQFGLYQESLKSQRESRALSPPIEVELELENIAGSGDFSGADEAEVTLALSSVIELGGKARSRVAVIDATSEKLAYEQQAATLDILGELTALYINAVATQESIKLAEETVALSTRMLKSVQRRASKGAAPDAEVMRAKAALIASSIRLETQTRNLERQKVGLCSYWGARSPDFQVLNAQLFRSGPPANFESLMKRAESSPAISVLASESRLKDAEVKLAQAQNRVDIGWQLGIRRFEGTDETAFTAGISVPLFNAKRNRASVASAIVQRDILDYRKSDALLKLHARLYSAFSQWEENRRAVERMDSKLIPALEQTLALTEQAYEAGRYRYQEWISAQKELLAARQQRIEAATAAQLSRALIEQLVAIPLGTESSSH